MKPYRDMELHELLVELCPDCYDPAKVDAIEHVITARAKAAASWLATVGDCIFTEETIFDAIIKGRVTL